LTFFGVKSEPSAYLCVQVKVKTKALSLVYLNPDHQDLIDRILGLHAKGWIPKKISEHLNALGVNSWSGKLWEIGNEMPGVIRSQKLKASDDQYTKEQKKKALASTVSRYLRRAEESIQRVGQGLSP
jgi:hypothetical protein